MKKVDDLAKEYEEALVKIGHESVDAKEKVRVILREQLKTRQIALHKELREIRTLLQKTRGG